MSETVDPNAAEAAPNTESYPSPEAIDAAAQVGRDVVDDPSQVGVDKASDAYTVWRSDDGTRSREEVDAEGQRASLKAVRKSDIDETRLVPAPVETVSVMANTGQTGRAKEAGHVMVSGGKLMLATYTDFSDRSRDLSDSDHPSAALAQAMRVINEARGQLENEARSGK